MNHEQTTRTESTMKAGDKVTIKSAGHWADGDWGIITHDDGDCFHVAHAGDKNTSILFDRDELTKREPKRSAQ